MGKKLMDGGLREGKLRVRSARRETLRVGTLRARSARMGTLRVGMRWIRTLRMVAGGWGEGFDMAGFLVRLID